MTDLIGGLVVVFLAFVAFWGFLGLFDREYWAMRAVRRELRRVEREEAARKRSRGE